MKIIVRRKFIMKEEKGIIDRLVEEWNHNCPESDSNAMLVVSRLIKFGKLLEKNIVI